QALLDRAVYLGLIVGVNVSLQGRKRARETAGGQIVNRREITRPADRVGADVPGPDADLSGFEHGTHGRQVRKRYVSGRFRLVGRAQSDLVLPLWPRHGFILAMVHLTH